MKKIAVEDSLLSLHTPEDFGIFNAISATDLILEMTKELDKLSPKRIKEDGHAHIFIEVSYESISSEVLKSVKSKYKECGWKNIRFTKATDTTVPMTSIYLFC